MASFKNTPNSTRRSKNHYDIAIWGANLAGVSLAVDLSKRGKRVLLIEEKEAVGGALAPIQTLKGDLPSSLNFVPSSEQNKAILSWLSGLIERPLVLGEINHDPKTFNEGQLRSFVGFGDKNFMSVDELSFYNCPDQLELSRSPTQWIQNLYEKFEGETLFKSEVTDIICENGKIKEIIINGGKKYTAEQYICCESPKFLSKKIIPFDGLTPKVRQKISKAHFWTTVCLHYTHSQPLSEDLNLHFLMGNKMDNEPCLGRFFPVKQAPMISDEGTSENNEIEASQQEQSLDTTEQQDSLWMSFIPAEVAEDDDFVGGVIRHMKKQIKRVYPAVLEDPANEKITVHTHSHGELNLSLKSPGQIPKLSNFFLASGTIAEKRNIIGQLTIAKDVLEAHWNEEQDPFDDIPNVSLEPPEISM